MNFAFAGDRPYKANGQFNWKVNLFMWDSIIDLGAVKTKPSKKNKRQE
jgi:hypothetical protein